MWRQDAYIHIFETKEGAAIAMFEERLKEKRFQQERRLVYHLGEAFHFEGMSFQRGYPMRPPLVFHFFRGCEELIHEVEFSPGNPARVLGERRLLVTTTFARDDAEWARLEVRLMIVRACILLQSSFGPFEGISMMSKTGERDFVVQSTGAFDEPRLKGLHDELARMLTEKD